MSQRFFSTKSPGQFVDVKEAVLRSLPADNGLYMPEELGELTPDFWQNWRDLSLAEIGVHVARAVFKDSVPEAQLANIVHESANFAAPLVTVKEKEHVLELFHGPTLAFKDFGARFMARLMGWLTRDDDELLTVLVATSGDTGGAVASAFHGVPGTRVVILYPKGKVSGLQEKQLTTLGGNISALEIEGTFDDCQRLVKSAFLKREMSEKLNLTSANSAATNRNDVVPEYLREGKYRPRPSVATISNAMDVGAPSNFARMENIFGNEWESMKSRITGYSYDDDITRESIRRIHAETAYTLEPHGAVAWLAAEAWRQSHPEDHTVVLETAHPSKFLDVMEEELGAGEIDIPERLACLAEREKVAVAMAADEVIFHDWLQNMA